VRDDRGNFVGLDRYIFVLRDFVALDLVVPLDGIAGLGVNEFASNPMAGRPIDRAERCVPRSKWRSRPTGTVTSAIFRKPFQLALGDNVDLAKF
jgi:hypothetical protein